MRYLLIFLLLIFIHPSFSQSKDDEEVISLSKRKFKWMVDKNIDSLEMILDERLSYIHSNGWIQTKKDFLNDFSHKLIYHEISVSEMKVHTYRKSAVITGKGHFSVTMDGNLIGVDLLFTEVYVRTGGKWKLVSRHANRLN